MSELIRASKVSHFFGEVPALIGVDLSLNPGETIAISGNNGSGKTTLLRLLARNLRPTSGQLWFSAEASSVYFLGGQNCLYLELSARENFLLCFDCDQTRLMELKGFLEIERFWEQPVRTCSLGVRKKIGLIRALVSGARVLLLDEPFANLDQDSREAVAEILKQEIAKGRGIVLSCHEREISSQMSKVIELKSTPFHGGAQRC